MTENEKLELVNQVLPPVESRNQITADFPYAESFPELISFDQAKASVFNLISRQLFSNDKVLNDSKANKASTLAGYGINDTYTKDDLYTKEEVNSAIATKIADLIAGAPTKFDTLKEIADWIEADTSNAAELQADVSALKTGKADVSHTHTISDVTNLSNATQSKAGLMTAADKAKLDNLPSSITGYTLPEATNSTLGGVKIGENISLSSGTISLSKANVTSALGFTPATSSHTHDDRYYTESEIDSKLAGKANSSHTHSQYLTSHATVDSALSSTSTNAVQNKVINSALAGKAASSHTHDDRYYTESEVDSKLSGKAASNHTHSQYLTSHQDISGKANLSGASFSGAVSIPTLTVTSALTIPGGKIWIA